MPGDLRRPNCESLYQPDPPGLIFPERPTFATLANGRDYRRRHLVAAVRAFAL
jgi:hypothetical protein